MTWLKKLICKWRNRGAIKLLNKWLKEAETATPEEREQAQKDWTKLKALLDENI